MIRMRRAGVNSIAIPLAAYVFDKLEAAVQPYDGGGQLEDMDKKTEQIMNFFARLVEVLADKGKLTADEVAYITTEGFEVIELSGGTEEG